MAGLAIFFALLFGYSTQRNAKRERASFFRDLDGAPGKERFYGFHPLQIFQQVQEGNIPPTCQVFSPQAPNLRKVVGATIVIATLLWMVLLICIFYIALWSNTPFNLLSILRVLIPSLCLALVTSAIVVRGVRRKADAVLILFPEGVVRCERCSDEAKRYFNVIAFANLAHLEVRVFPTNRNFASLELQYRDGNEEELLMDSKFASSVWLAQQVLANYVRYVERNRSGQE